MNFKIWQKLALLLLTTTSLTLVIGIGLSQRSFKSGFMDYLQRQEFRRLEILGSNLLVAYKENGSWEFIRGNKPLWLSFLRPRPGRFGFMQGMHRGQRPPNDFFPGSGRPRGFSHMGGGRRLPKMVLLDNNKKLLVGTPLANGSPLYHPLKSNDIIVAYLKTEKPKIITDRLDKMFAAQQNQAFFINTLVALLVSIVVALLASIYFKKRIRGLNNIAQQLTSGLYEKRVEIKQKDELGQLGMDFNTLAETLQKNQQSQQQWIADISHELRTPIAILKGELEALDDGIRPLDGAAIQSLQQEIERLGKLVEDLYQLSVSDMGALKYEKSSFVFNDLLTELEDAFKVRFDKQKLALSLNCELPEGYEFHGDRQRLFQLLSNLLENSLRYTDATGQVIIYCEDKEQQLIVAIEDSSPGIAKEKLPLIFDRLFRLESSRSRSNGGAGLGLAIAKQIVLAHQGEIFAKASDLGGISISCVFPK